MKSILRASLALLLLSAVHLVAQDVVSAVHGTITKLDSTTKTMVVKTKDGTEHTVKFVDKTTVRGLKAGAEDTAMGAKDNFHGLKEGTDVVAHYTEKGNNKTDDGTEEPFKLSVHATADAGKDIAKGTEKSAKVTVYFPEEAGKKTAHFFEKI